MGVVFKHCACLPDSSPSLLSPWRASQTTVQSKITKGQNLLERNATALRKVRFSKWSTHWSLPSFFSFTRSFVNRNNRWRRCLVSGIVRDDFTGVRSCSSGGTFDNCTAHSSPTDFARPTHLPRLLQEILQRPQGLTSWTVTWRVLFIRARLMIPVNTLKYT